MDQELFEFKIKIVGKDLQLFIETLAWGGFEVQANEVDKQLNEQLKEIQKEINKI